MNVTAISGRPASATFGNRIHEICVAVCASASLFFALLPLATAKAQGMAADTIENGQVGLAGMLAGLLIFALVALYNHQRRSRDVLSRVAALEATIEAREDMIWTLEERLVRAARLAEGRQKAEAASRAKSRFLAVVSHEVRTPLNGILGMAELLEDTALTPEQQTYTRAMKTSGEALLGLIEEILDFSKIEAGRLDLDARPYDLHALVTDVVELIAPRAQRKGIEIAADIGDDVPRRVAGDAARLRQVLLNLAGNAVKFTEAGGVWLVVEPAGSGRIRFEVSDTGPGIDAEMQRRLFREFEQGDATLARQHGGAGLGLSIAARIVERMGGEIELDSTPAGSKFSFAVELPPVRDDAQVPAPELGGISILVASPSPATGPLLTRRLTAWGGNVRLAVELTQAKALLSERKWRHVLIDRAFGHDAAIALVHVAAPHADHRHVLLSPADRGKLDALRDAGFDSYLVKPVRAVSLAARLDAPGLSPPLVPELDATVERVLRSTARPLTVLVAEDNEINALLIEATLTRLGHTPTVVDNGLAAVDTIATAHALGMPFDIVLMDLHLPGMDGIDATRRIRALGNDGGRIPIVALTANAAVDDRDECLAAGMDDFVAKPVDRRRLETAMQAAVAAWRARATVAAA
jgi:signal transduction histidine kinase/CheY-like chemotaxis protein